MPIVEFTMTEIQQVCANCRTKHRIPLKQGSRKSKKEPFALADGDTLEVIVDGGTPETITFQSADFADIGNTLAAEVVARVQSLTGATSDVDENAVRITSDLIGMASSIEISGGTAASKLGFLSGPEGPRMLGVEIGGQRNVNIMILPQCPECLRQECLERTFDALPSGFDASHHAAHKRCVNSLGQYLRTENYSDPAVKPIHDAETEGPPEIDPAFPPGPLTLTDPTEIPVES